MPTGLIAGSDRIHEWAAAPIGGYEVVEHRAALTTWRDLATGRHVSGPNIGSAVNLDAGRHVIGRLVPTDKGHMFETKPLPVPQALAGDISEQPTGWVELLGEAKAARRGGVVGTDGDHLECFVADVPPLLWMGAVLETSGYRHVDPDDPHVEDVMARMVLDASGIALETMVDAKPPRNFDIWPCLGAAMLAPYISSALPRLVQRRDAPVLRQLSGRLADPASTICLQLAEAARDAA